MSEKKENRGDATRMSIINAAGSLFAEKGFAATTIRDICARADVNNAAVNYHFRDKENLFGEVVRYGFRAAHEKYPPDYNFENTKNAEERLRQFIWNMLVREFDPELPPWFSCLISRNMQFAHSHKQEILKGHKEKVRGVISGILSELITGRGKQKEQRIRIAESGVMGTILFFLHPRRHEQNERIPLFETGQDFERFIDSVYSYSRAGVQALNRKE
jgi:AcrR family transcriptional regulator